MKAFLIRLSSSIDFVQLVEKDWLITVQLLYITFIQSIANQLIDSRYYSRLNSNTTTWYSSKKGYSYYKHRPCALSMIW